jgi:hypothetical protein
MTTQVKPKTSFWIIAVVALIWNIMGVFQFLSSTLMKEEMYETLTDPQIALLNSLPAWYNIVFAISVFAGLLGCVVLLLRKKIAIPLFLVSLIAVLVMMGYWLLVSNAMEIYGTEAVIMPLFVIIVAIFLYFYSKGAKQKGWIN